MPNTNRKDRILSVDDNESNQYAIKRILERENFEVLLAHTGQEALDQLVSAPDLIVLDVNLPDISGFDVCRQIKSSAEYSSIPVLHVSASFVQSKDKVTGLESGADGYLAQPIDASVLLATVRSLLRIRKAEREKAALIAELKEERQLREQFVSTLTHDLRNPLTAAKIGAQILLRKYDQDETTKNQITKVITNINRTDLMMQDLLDANLLRAGARLPIKIGETSMKRVISEVLQEFEYQKTAKLEVTGVDDIIGQWDEGALKRALENLVSNAFKYGAPDQKITIDLAQVDADQVKLSVHNFGNPIPASEMDTLFDYFKRSKSAESSHKPGWGLGLSLVRGVAESHDGTVTLVSNVESGTTFTLWLPLKSRAE